MAYCARAPETSLSTWGNSVNDDVPRMSSTVRLYTVTLYLHNACVMIKQPADATVRVVRVWAKMLPSHWIMDEVYDASYKEETGVTSHGLLLNMIGSIYS